MQPIQIREHNEFLDLYLIDTGEFKGEPIAWIITQWGKLEVYKPVEIGTEGEMPGIQGEPLFVSTDLEACQMYAVGLAYQYVANKQA